MKHPFTMLTVMAAFFALAPLSAAVAADLDIKAFHGKFEGGGVAQNEDSLYFGVTARDFDVEIAPDGAGFKLNWMSVIRGGGSPANPDSRRKSSTLTFLPTDRPRVWRASVSGDPVTGGQVAWARISENTLSVYLMVVRDDGAYELQQYDRTLGARGMELIFTRLRDGEKVRSVKGLLVKVGK